MTDDKTREVLAEMLKENTGTSLLDSGGSPKYKDGCYVGSDHGYGRSWEQNQCRSFEREAPVSLNFRYGYVDFTHNIYHWLAERLEYDQEMNDLFDGFVIISDSENEPWSPEANHTDWRLMSAGGERTWHWLASHFPKYLESLDFDLGGIYGEGEPIRVNTCNGEDLLSQVILYTYFTLEGWAEDGPANGVYIILQIHGGCDVRGGYTRPRLFKMSDMHGEEAIFFNANGHISTEDGEHSWQTDDGYHWYPENGKKNLEEHEINNFPGVITITHSGLFGPEELVIKDVEIGQAQLLADAYTDIFNAYSELFPEIHASHDLNEDVILVDDLGQGFYRGSKLEGY